MYLIVRLCFSLLDRFYLCFGARYLELLILLTEIFTLVKWNENKLTAILIIRKSRNKFYEAERFLMKDTLIVLYRGLI